MEVAHELISSTVSSSSAVRSVPSILKGHLGLPSVCRVESSVRASHMLLYLGHVAVIPTTATEKQTRKGNAEKKIMGYD